MKRITLLVFVCSYGALFSMSKRKADSELLNPVEKNRLLLQAAFKGKSESLLRQIKAGAEVNCTNAQQRTPLHLVAKFGHMSCIKPLIEAGADVLARDTLGETPFLVAAKSDKFECIASMYEEPILVSDEIMLQLDDALVPLPKHFYISSVLSEIIEGVNDAEATVPAPGLTAKGLQLLFGLESYLLPLYIRDTYDVDH